MKKLVVLFLVLGCVSGANAGVVDLMITSLNGQAIDPVKEILIVPSDTVGMDIFYRDDTGSLYLMSMSYDVVVSGPGTLDMSQAYLGPDFDPGISLIVPPIGVSATSTTGGATDGALVVGDIFVHYDSAGDVIVNMVENPSYSAGGTYEHNVDFSIFRRPQFSGVIIHNNDVGATCWDCLGHPYGDATCDGTVSIFDLVAVKKGWGTNAAVDPHGEGPGEYNCCADFTNDSKINVLDLVRLKRNWGSSGLGSMIPKPGCP